MSYEEMNIQEADLGVLKAAFLTPDRDNLLYTGVLTTEEIAEFVKHADELSREEKMKMIAEKIGAIERGEVSEDEIEKREAEIVLLLKSIPFQRGEADYYWQDRESSAKCEDNGKVLIEVAAMHPLIEGKPGKEFTEHLEQAIHLYQLEKEKGNQALLYVPGSVHYVLDPETKLPKVDLQPLSEAGKEYLIEHGIPEEDIRANIINLDIKGEDGVYNSGDECYVATQIAREEGCGRIMSVVSPVQLYRKALFYQEFGYNAEMYATGTEKTGHNYIGETFWSLFITYMNDQDWQTGFLSYLTRTERDIDYTKKIEDYQDVVQDIIKVGRASIPKEVLAQKAIWQGKYNTAKTNMEQAKSNGEGILIDVVRTEGKQELEMERLKEILDAGEGKKITVLLGQDATNQDIVELLENYPNASLKTIPERNHQTIASAFLRGNYQNFYGMYPSSISMKEAVDFINEGVVPIISTLPDIEPHYIDSISSLFDEVMRAPEVEKMELSE